MRLEKNKEYVVSILIDVKFRKKGLATKALILAEKKLDINSVLKAEVNFNNMASIAMFSKIGYVKKYTNNKVLIMKKNLNKIKIIDRIEKIRAKNNGSWMNILRLAYKNAPKECAILMSKIYKDDMKISKLVKQLTK